MSSPASALQRLRDDPTHLKVICEGHGVILLTAFGSVLRPTAEPHDLDLGVLFEHAGTRDALGVRDGLVELTGYEGIDLVVLNGAGPVIREHALVGAEVLYEARRSVHSRATITATMERMDTDGLRRLALEELAR